MEIGRIFCLGSIPMALISVIFFVYSNIRLSDVEEGLDNEICKDFFIYNLTYVVLFLLSIVVFMLFICCSSLCGIGFFILNSVLIVSQMIEIYIEKTERCNSVCHDNCSDLVEVNDKVNIAIIINTVIIGITGIFIACNLIGKCL